MAESVIPIEIPWQTVKHDRKIRTLQATFGLDQTVKLDFIQPHSFGLSILVARKYRIECGDHIVAVDHLGLSKFEYFSNKETVRIYWTQLPKRGEINFGSEAKFTFVSDTVAGYWLCDLEGGRLLRHALPWRDRDTEGGVCWISHLVTRQFPWPETGIAAALLCVAELARQEHENDVNSSGTGWVFGA